MAAGVQASTNGSVASSVIGNYGSITIAADGSYSYVVDNASAAVQALRTTVQTLTDVFSYTITDTAGTTSTAQITVTIHGANDTPTAVADAGTAVEAGGLANGGAGSDATGNVLGNDTDVDAGDTKTVNAVAAGIAGSATGNVGASVAGNYGSITIQADGSYQYTIDNNDAACKLCGLARRH